MNDDADLNDLFEALLAPKPPRPEGEDFFCLTVPISDDGDPAWGTCITIMGSWDTLCGQFDVNRLPPGAVLCQGDAARRYLSKAAKDEARYQAEKRMKRHAAVRN